MRSGPGPSGFLAGRKVAARQKPPRPAIARNRQIVLRYRIPRAARRPSTRQLISQVSMSHSMPVLPTMTIEMIPLSRRTGPRAAPEAISLSDRVSMSATCASCVAQRVDQIVLVRLVDKLRDARSIRRSTRGRCGNAMLERAEIESHTARARQETPPAPHSVLILVCSPACDPPPRKATASKASASGGETAADNRPDHPAGSSGTPTIGNSRRTCSPLQLRIVVDEDERVDAEVQLLRDRAEGWMPCRIPVRLERTAICPSFRAISGCSLKGWRASLCPRSSSRRPARRRAA